MPPFPIPLLRHVREGQLRNHRYKIGETVRLLPTGVSGVGGDYKVLALLPEERGDHQYKVQSASSTQQRVVKESQLAEQWRLTPGR
jgi:hypothetical protein